MDPDASGRGQDRAVQAAPVSLPSARVLATLFERAPEAITITDPEGRQIMVNAAGLRLLGFDESFRRPDDGFSFVHPDDLAVLDAHRALLTRMREDGADGSTAPAVRFRVRAGDGRWRWLELVAADMSDVPEVGGRVSFSRDVTEAEERKQALVETEARLAALVASLTSGSFVTDAAGTVLFANARLIELFDLDGHVDDLVGGLADELLDRLGQRLVDQGPLAAAAADEPRHRTVPVSKRDGGEIDVEAIEIRSDDEGFGRLWLFHDATARRDEARRQQALLELEQRARQAAELHVEQLEAYDRLRNEFVAHVSHELRTPLTAIAGASQLLASDPGALSGEARRHLAIIERNAGRLTRMIEDLLVVGRLDAGVLDLERSWVRPRGLLTEILAALEPAAAERSVVLHLQGDDDPVWADDRRLAEIAGNLVGNAVKFTAPGTAVVVSAATEGDEWVLSVRDHGPGIPPDQREAVFERFVRTADAERAATPGAGLGLAIVKGLVDLHGGTVAITEAVGGGALVTCRLPRGGPHGGPS